MHSAVAEGGGGNSGLRSSSTYEEKEVSLASFCVRMRVPMLIPWDVVELVMLLMIISKKSGCRHSEQIEFGQMLNVDNPNT